MYTALHDALIAAEHLQHQGDFPTPGSRQQRHLRHEPAAERPVQLLDPALHAGKFARVYLGQALQLRALRDAGEACFDGASATPSTSVFHAPQCGHWPCHFGDSPPHSWQA